MDLKLEIVSEDREFDALAKNWKKLVDALPAYSAPLQWEWMREWWRVFSPRYAETSEGLCILVCKDGEEIVGILPLYLRRGSVRRLGFIGTGEAAGEVAYPEYLDVIALPDHRESCVRLISSYISGPEAPPWDELYLGILAFDSPLIAMTRPPYRLPQTMVREIWHSAPHANLDGGFDKYLGRLSSSSRQFARRILKQRGGEGLSFQIARSEEEALEFFSELVAIHQRRWRGVGATGAFATSAICSFHQGVIKSLMPSGGVLLARLVIDRRTCAVLYGYRRRHAFEFYQSGVELDIPGVKSPGILAHLLLMEWLASQGVSTYDFLAGESDYKSRLSTSNRKVIEATLVRQTLRSGLHGVSCLFQRAIGKLRVTPGL